MLVLTRRRGESIVIGDDIEIYVLGVSGEVARIGIKAPQEIPVYRREIYDEIQEENIAAARAAAGMARQLKDMDILLLSLEQKGEKGDKNDGET